MLTAITLIFALISACRAVEPLTSTNVVDCHATTGPMAGYPCIFPFKASGRTYYACVDLWSVGAFWCPTVVSGTDNEVFPGAFAIGDCSEECPKFPAHATFHKCREMYAPQRKCAFPYKDRDTNLTVNHCLSTDGKIPWCPTEVDEDGFAVMSVETIGLCHIDTCPVSFTEGQDQYGSEWDYEYFFPSTKNGDYLATYHGQGIGEISLLELLQLTGMRSVKYYDLLDLELSFDTRYDGISSQIISPEERLANEMQLIVQYYDLLLAESSGQGCKTMDGDRCILPWIDSADGLKYDGCKQRPGGMSWCPSQVNMTGHFIESHGHVWGHCKEDCPVTKGKLEPINDACLTNLDESCIFPFTYAANGKTYTSCALTPGRSGWCPITVGDGNVFREGVDDFGSCKKSVCPETEGRYEASKDPALKDMAVIYQSYVEYEEQKKTIMRHGASEICWTEDMELCILYWTDFDTKEFITGCLPSEIQPGRYWCPLSIRYKEFVRGPDVTGYCSPDCPLHSMERRNQMLQGPPDSLPGRDIHAESNCHTEKGKKCVIPWLFSGMQEVKYGCQLDESDGRYWCPTETDAGRQFSPTSSMWGFCNPDCPVHDLTSSNNNLDSNDLSEDISEKYSEWHQFIVVPASTRAVSQGSSSAGRPTIFWIWHSWVFLGVLIAFIV